MKDRLRLIHTGDIHIGTPFTGSGLKLDKIRERRADLLEVLQKIAQETRERSADALLVSGDLFEEEYVSNTEVIRAFSIFRNLAPVPVVISPGNHDPYRSSSPYSYEELPENVYVFKKEEIEVLKLRELGLNIYGFGFTRNHIQDEIWNDFKLPRDKENILNIILTHGAAYRNRAGQAENYAPVDISFLESCGVEYVALGHYHKKSIIVEDAFSKSVRAAYPGSPEALKAGDSTEHVIYQVDLIRETRQTLLEEISSSKRKCFSYRLNFTGSEKHSEVDEIILRKLTSPEARDNIVDLTLSGRLAPGITLDLESYEVEASGPFSVRIKDKTIPDFDVEAISAEDTARGLFCRNILSRIQEEPEKKHQLEKTLYLGLAAFEGIKVEDLPV